MGDKSWQPVRMDLREAKPPRELLGWWDRLVRAQRMVEKVGGLGYVRVPLIRVLITWE